LRVRGVVWVVVLLVVADGTERCGGGTVLDADGERLLTTEKGAEAFLIFGVPRNHLDRGGTNSHGASKRKCRARRGHVVGLDGLLVGLARVGRVGCDLFFSFVSAIYYTKLYGAPTNVLHSYSSAYDIL